ncbi:hypothetical protein, partial [Candidatus Aalborgicola defluviihabitans]|uniref:hypothetical protein n=1 Tax=Candidatus Aalborgicola defluviihabitans TaxID=3386187 RepID=UPI001D1C731D|nr:hypothetical protein [Burkholderiales bacterium]
MDPLSPTFWNACAPPPQAARTHARVPYSHYAVGAAMLDDQGAIPPAAMWKAPLPARLVRRG